MAIDSLHPVDIENSIMWHVEPYAFSEESINSAELPRQLLLVVNFLAKSYRGQL